jgi:hypothetical protein
VTRVAAALVAILVASPALADQVPIRHPIRRPRPPSEENRIANELTEELRKPGDPSSPLNYVRIAVDVSQPGAPTHRLTRKSAVGEAQAWRRLLTDEKRGAVRCLVAPSMSGIICLQLPHEEARVGGKTELGMFLHFCRDPDLRLEAVSIVKTTDEVRKLLTSVARDKACAR